jgi:chalcone isomerase
MEKFIRVVVTKELEGAQYGLQIEMRDCLASLYNFEEEKKALEKLVESFQEKYLKKNSLVPYDFLHLRKLWRYLDLP